MVPGSHRPPENCISLQSIKNLKSTEERSPLPRRALCKCLLLRVDRLLGRSVRLASTCWLLYWGKLEAALTGVRTCPCEVGVRPQRPERRSRAGKHTRAVWPSCQSCSQLWGPLLQMGTESWSCEMRAPASSLHGPSQLHRGTYCVWCWGEK